MYLIDISLKNESLSEEEQAKQLDAHRAWFAKYFQQGNFLLLGPYLDKERAGVIIAQTENRAQLEQILAEDVYYPDLADYQIREFKAAMVAENIQQFQGA
ncbi:MULTISPECIES: YciI family protein [Pasteurellaceae]|uniref:YciI family protein n=1 Tax=Pasteurellaceae TaxID=712 RepID=UPI0023F02F91|nr:MULTISPECIES: YciI family protein [Pasteurellaceae]MDD7544521.1 YciI family protein [Actinobacillus porcinus]MDG2955331.1 YciI family protein [Exercitatus varius]MDG2963613.1 YciI family protein [Exercitatus varius]MDY5847900.1 YciI family protein [Actinobacillus porcinus]